jgi:hypothetical protein
VRIMAIRFVNAVNLQVHLSNPFRRS